MESRTQDLNRLRGEAAALIREHLWLSKAPPSTPGPKPWTMGRDLSIWNALVRQGEDPHTLNGAIQSVRTITNLTGPITLHIFYSRSGKTRPILERAKAHWLNNEHGGLRHIGQILRSLADA